jgi:hypothetical protein
MAAAGGFAAAEYRAHHRLERAGVAPPDQAQRSTKGCIVTPQLGEAWVYLAASPLLGLTMTLLAYQGATWLHRRSGGHPLANPVLLAVAVLVALLALTGTSYQTYFDGAQFVHFLLGPATVALAIPLYAQFDRLRRMALPLLGGAAGRILDRGAFGGRHRRPAWRK